MKGKLGEKLRKQWDALMQTEGKAIGIADCRPFLENKLVNDVFYEGTLDGKPCIVKCSSRAPDSIANEYELSRKLAATDSAVCAAALAHWRSPDGRMAFVVTPRLPGPSLTDMFVGGIDAEEAIAVMEDMVRIAKALLESGIVWRDIIPDNFMKDESGHLRLIDAQFAIDRNAFREDPYLLANWSYRTLLFAHHPDMAGRGWNDVAMMLHFTRYLPASGRAKELREQLKSMLDAAAFPVEYGLADDVRMALHLAGIKVRLLFSSRRRSAVLRDRASRALRFLLRKKGW